jgi:hypothetical protein
MLLLYLWDFDLPHSELVEGGSTGSRAEARTMLCKDTSLFVVMILCVIITSVLFVPNFLNVCACRCLASERR